MMTIRPYWGAAEDNNAWGRKIMEWTDERVALLKEMWTAGYSARQIAEKLGGTTRNAVIGKANRLGLSKPTKQCFVAFVQAAFVQLSGNDSRVGHPIR